MIPYRISLLGNYSADLVLKREINRFRIAEDPCGTFAFVRFGLARGELRKDLDVEMIVSVLDWTIERFQDALLTAELDPGLFRRQGETGREKMTQAFYNLWPCCGERSALFLRFRSAAAHCEKSQQLLPEGRPKLGRACETSPKC